jgi:hypothetical protein
VGNLGSFGEKHGPRSEVKGNFGEKWGKYLHTVARTFKKMAVELVYIHLENLHGISAAAGGGMVMIVVRLWHSKRWPRVRILAQTLSANSFWCT